MKIEAFLAFWVLLMSAKSKYFLTLMYVKNNGAALMTVEVARSFYHRTSEIVSLGGKSRW